MATQALLKSLCYDPRGQDTVQQTKAGLPYYDGNPYDFEHWHFVVMGKYDAYASKKDVEVQTQDLVELSVKVIEGLKDDASKCAMDLGRDVVVAPDGVLRIAEAIKASWAGKLEIATKELYREGGKKDGILARVPGESMASHVSRRRRWYRSLTTLDKTFSIPEHLQLEMMMDCAGITDHQQQLARLAATKPLTLEKMSLALVQEYPLIHEKELSRGSTHRAPGKMEKQKERDSHSNINCGTWTKSVTLKVRRSLKPQWPSVVTRGTDIAIGQVFLRTNACLVPACVCLEAC